MAKPGKDSVTRRKSARAVSSRKKQILRARFEMEHKAKRPRITTSAIKIGLGTGYWRYIAIITPIAMSKHTNKKRKISTRADHQSREGQNAGVAFESSSECI